MTYNILNFYFMKKESLFERNCAIPMNMKWEPVTLNEPISYSPCQPPLLREQSRWDGS